MSMRTARDISAEQLAMKFGCVLRRVEAKSLREGVPVRVVPGESRNSIAGVINAACASGDERGNDGSLVVEKIEISERAFAG